MSNMEKEAWGKEDWKVVFYMILLGIVSFGLVSVLMYYIILTS